jgi:hypothetical protein
MVGLDSMRELLETPLRDTDVSFSAKLEAISDMLDRNPATAKVGANGGQGSSPVNVVIGQMSDNELISKARDLFNRVEAQEQPQIAEAEVVEDDSSD